MIGLRIIDAVVIVLKENGSLTSKEAYEKIIEKGLYNFGAKNPVNVVNSEIRCHCEMAGFSKQPLLLSISRLQVKKESTTYMRQLILTNRIAKTIQRKLYIPKKIFYQRKRLIKHIFFIRMA